MLLLAEMAGNDITGVKIRAGKEYGVGLYSMEWKEHRDDGISYSSLFYGDTIEQAAEKFMSKMSDSFKKFLVFDSLGPNRTGMYITEPIISKISEKAYNYEPVSGDLQYLRVLCNAIEHEVRSCVLINLDKGEYKVSISNCTIAGDDDCSVTDKDIDAASAKLIKRLENRILIFCKGEPCEKTRSFNELFKDF